MMQTPLKESYLSRWLEGLPGLRSASSLSLARVCPSARCRPLSILLPQRRRSLAPAPSIYRECPCNRAIAPLCFAFFSARHFAPLSTAAL